MNGTRRRSSTIPSLAGRFGVSIASRSSSALARSTSPTTFTNATAPEGASLTLNEHSSAISARLPGAGLPARAERHRIETHRDRCPLLGGVEVDLAGHLGYQRDAEAEPA